MFTCLLVETLASQLKQKDGRRTSRMGSSNRLSYVSLSSFKLFGFWPLRKLRAKPIQACQFVGRGRRKQKFRHAEQRDLETSKGSVVLCSLACFEPLDKRAFFRKSLHSSSLQDINTLNVPSRSRLTSRVGMVRAVDCLTVRLRGLFDKCATVWGQRRYNFHLLLWQT